VGTSIKKTQRILNMSTYITLGFLSYALFISYSLYEIFKPFVSKNLRHNKLNKYIVALFSIAIVLLVIDMLRWIAIGYHEEVTIIDISAPIFFTLGFYTAMIRNSGMSVKTTLNKKDSDKPIKHVVTHAGMFHADDVFSYALLNLLNNIQENPAKYQLQRVNNAVDIPENADIVFDIGGGKFDHHQDLNQFHEDENNTPYASFGLLWREHGHEIIDYFVKDMKDISEEAKTDIFNSFEKSLVVPIDANDNGIFTNDFSVSNVIRDFNDEAGSDSAFLNATILAQTIIGRRLGNVIIKVTKEQGILSSANFITPEIAVLPFHGPYSKLSELHPDLKLVIYQSNRNGFNINVVRDKLEDGTPVDRFTIPQSAATMQGVVFLHKAGFLMVTDTEENAIANATALLKIK